MRLVTILISTFFVFPLFSQTLYNYDEVWSGKPEAINVASNNNSLKVYTEIYNESVSPFTDPNWQQLTDNTIYVQENFFSEFSEWGGVNINMYRDLVGYENRDRPEGNDPNTATMVNVNSSMTVAAIQNVIDNATPNTTIFFETGTYDFDESLWIKKDNLTIEGETDGSGNPLVIIDMFDIANVTGSIASAFQVRKPAISSIFGESQSMTALPILNTNTTTNVNAEDKTVTLTATDISMVEAGDFIVFAYTGDPFFNERDTGERLRSVTEIESVNQATKQVTLKTGVGIDYKPNRGVSTNEILIIEKEDIIRDVVIKNFIFQSFSDTDYNAQVDNNDFTNSYPSSGFTNGNSAISIRTGHEIDVENIIVRNAMSNGIAVSGGFEIYIDNYLFDGAMNNGAGGNGYGLIVADMYYSNVTNFSTGTNKPVRHAIVFAFGTSCGYNNINMPYSNSNADFHGGPDYGNIIYFDDIDVRQMDMGNAPIFDYRYEWHPRNFGDYTPPPLNQMQNTIIMKTANAPKEGDIAGYSGFDNPNDNIDDGRADRNDGIASPNNQTVYASNNGATINTWGQDDIIVSGTGDDVIDGGDHQDFFVFFSNSGNDIIKSYVNSEGVKNTLADNEDYRGFSFRTERDSENNLLSRGDKIVIKENINNTGIASPEDVSARASQNGNNVLIDLGEGNTITIEDFNVSNMSAEDFEILIFTDKSNPNYSNSNPIESPLDTTQSPLELIEVTNLMTPNNDGQNDTWIVENLSGDYTIKVFTKTGQVVFETDDYNIQPWDGTKDGQELPEDVYYYIISFEGLSEVKTGYITLIK